MFILFSLLVVCSNLCFVDGNVAVDSYCIDITVSINSSSRPVLVVVVWLMIVHLIM